MTGILTSIFTGHDPELATKIKNYLAAGKKRTWLQVGADLGMGKIRLGWAIVLHPSGVWPNFPALSFETMFADAAGTLTAVYLELLDSTGTGVVLFSDLCRAVQARSGSTQDVEPWVELKNDEVFVTAEIMDAEKVVQIVEADTAGNDDDNFFDLNSQIDSF